MLKHSNIYLMSQQQINVVLVSIRDFPKKRGGGGGMGLGGLENIFLYKRGARQKKFGNHCINLQHDVGHKYNADGSVAG